MELIISIDGRQLLKKDEVVAEPIYCHDESGNREYEIHSEEIISLLTSDRCWRNLHPFGACTIGYRCEMECLLYLQYSIWQVLGLAEIGCIFLKQFPSLSIDRISVGVYMLKISEV